MRTQEWLGAWTTAVASPVATAFPRPSPRATAQGVAYSTPHEVWNARSHRSSSRAETLVSIWEEPHSCCHRTKPETSGPCHARAETSRRTGMQDGAGLDPEGLINPHDAPSVIKAVRLNLVVS
jgi:hypothetical protein